MPSGAIAVAVALVGAVVAVAVGSPRVLRRLPEPSEAEGKTAYADLATTRFVVTCTVLSALAVLVAALTLPAAVQPMWWVLAVPVLLVAAVDARTTWVPYAPTRVAWAAMVVATLVSAALAGDVRLLGRAALGALALGAFYLAFSRLSRGGIGLGDAQVAPLIGAATAAVDWPTFFAGVLLGSLAGAAYGVVRLVRRRRGVFAYLPAMLAGPYLACGWRWLSR